MGSYFLRLVFLFVFLGVLHPKKNYNKNLCFFFRGEFPVFAWLLSKARWFLCEIWDGINIQRIFSLELTLHACKIVNDCKFWCGKLSDSDSKGSPSFLRTIFWRIQHAGLQKELKIKSSWSLDLPTIQQNLNFSKKKPSP